MNELQVESLNAVEMTVEDVPEIPLMEDSTTRIIQAISPTATVTKSGTTATITVTDKNGTTTEEISDGTTPNVSAGTTTTGEAGSSAVVTRRSGTPDSAPIFDFTIPKGDKGDTGDKGDKGDPAIIITDDDSGNVSMEYSGFPVATGVSF